MEEKLKDLMSHMINSIQDAVPKERIGIAFSGGVDSCLVAKLCSDLGYDFSLLTVGFSGSHDIEFAKLVNQNLDFDHHIHEIDPLTFPQICKKIREKIQTENLSWNENSIAFFYVSKLANSLGIKTVITANGIDELFCGYNSYRDAFLQGEEHILNLMKEKLDNEKKMMVAVNLVSSENHVKILQPLLSDYFINYAINVPISEKITGSDDLYRKHIIRNLAIVTGVPEISAMARKKALQYGSQIHKSLLKIKKV